jgi:hypothetical protein
MKDMAGNELEVGMDVLVILPGYKHMVWGVIEKVGPKMATCSYTQWGYRHQTPRNPDQIVVPAKPVDKNYPFGEIPDWS